MDHAPLASLGARALAAFANPLADALLYPRAVDDYVQLLDPTWVKREVTARLVGIHAARDVVMLDLLVRRDGSERDRLVVVPTIDGRRTAREARVVRRRPGHVVVELDRSPSCPVAAWAMSVATIGDLVVLLDAEAPRSDTASLVFRRSTTSVDVDRTLPILDQAERAGLSPTFGCRRGVCHRCACALVRGAVRDTKTDAITSEPGAIIRPCVSVPVGHVEVDL